MTWSAHDDARIRAWLGASAPERAPRSILEATFERTRSLPHAAGRPRWREPRFALLLAAALALVAIVGGAVIVALSRPPTPPVTLPEPRFLAEFLWTNGYEFAVDAPPPEGLDAHAAAVAAEATSPEMLPFLGPPDPPMFGRLRCEWPALCGTPWSVAPDVGTTDIWSVWIVEYPQEEAYVVLSARDGKYMTAWYGDDLQSCSPDEIGTEPYCTAEMLEPEREIPTVVNIALQIWGQTIPSVESQYTTEREDNGPYWQNDDVDPLEVAATLVDDWRIVDAYQGAMACLRTACPNGIVKEPGVERIVVIVVVDDGERWVIVDAATGEVLKTDESPVDP